MQLALPISRPDWPDDSSFSPLGWATSLVLHAALVFIVMYFPTSQIMPPSLTNRDVFLISESTIERPKPQPVPMPQPKQPLRPPEQPKPVATPDSKPVPRPLPKPVPVEIPRPKPKAIVTPTADVLPKPADAEVTEQQSNPKPSNAQANDQIIAGPLNQTTNKADTAPKPPSATEARVDAKYSRENPLPVYPPMARRLGQEGTVTLKVLVSPDGKAEKVDIEKSSGFTQLDEAAAKAISLWKFVPATRDGQPIRQSLTTQWVYRLSNR